MNKTLSPIRSLIAAVMNAAASRLVRAVDPSQQPRAQWLGQHTSPKNAKRAARRAAKAKRVSDSQQLKARAVRRHKQTKHPKDATGQAFTLVGRGPQGDRRVWLGGISAQRGF